MPSAQLSRRHVQRAFKAAALLSSMIGLGAQSAWAADLPMYPKAPPVPAAVFSWTGFYVGGQIGYAWGRDHTTEYLTSNGAFTGFQWRYRLDHVVAGGYVGGNYQIGSVVIGAEADIEAAGNKGGFYDPPGAGDTHVKWQGTVRARLGWAAGPLLFYGTGGLSYADISHTYVQVITPIYETTAAVRTGWTAGAGIDYAVTRNLILRAEYRYTDYGKYRYDSVTAFPGLTGQQVPKFDTVRLGVAYKF